MTLNELSLLRLDHQQVSTHDFKNPADLVSWMGAMQAQDYNMVRWAVGIRLPGVSQAAVQHSIDQAEIIRTHVMRPTWHLVAAKDAGWMLDLTAPHIRTSLRSRHNELELTSAVLKKSLRTLEKALAGGQYLTRDELLTRFAKNKIATHDQRAAHILLWAELEKVICSGPMAGKKNTYALFDERVKNQITFTRDEGLMNLATRYFQSHGPATLQDFINWSSLPSADAKKALEFIRKELRSEKVDSATYWFKDTGRLLKATRKRVYLLPAFDEFIIGYKDRSACLPAKHKATAISINGIFWPVIVVDGTVMGLWKRTVVKKQSEVELNFFSKGLVAKDKDLKKLLAGEVEKVRTFFHSLE